MGKQNLTQESFKKRSTRSAFKTRNEVHTPEKNAFVVRCTFFRYASTCIFLAGASFYSSMRAFHITIGILSKMRKVGPKTVHGGTMVQRALVQNAEFVNEQTPDIDRTEVTAGNNVYIPETISTDDALFSVHNNLRNPFPRWDFKDSKTPDVSIMDSIIDFVRQEEEYFQSFSGNDEDIFSFGQGNIVHTSDHMLKNITHWWFPEALYVVDSTQVYTSQLSKNLSDFKTKAIQYIYDPAEQLMKIALNILRIEPEKQSKSRWPQLHQLLMEKNGSFPFLAHYSDFTGCNKNNWKENTQSIPLFTFAADVNCNNTFPFPSSQLYFSARPNADVWNYTMKERAKQYPVFSDKKSQVVWRGSLAGPMPEEVEKRGSRWHLTRTVHSESLRQTERDLFDVKLTYIPKTSQFDYINETQLGGTSKTNAMLMDEFQNYKAILDVDSNSWSKRFANLLCYNSVVLKVEPNYVEYFYHPTTQDEYTLQPWKHYIPIKQDMSDLVNKTSYALNIDNQHHVERIIKNANQWCSHKFTKDSIGRDILDIWEKYMTLLDTSDFIKTTVRTSLATQRDLSERNRTSWEKQWNDAKDGILKGPLKMVPVM